jgi:hypothetical protein
MKNSEYWKMRFGQLEEAQNQTGLSSYQQMERQYREAQKQIEGQISAWYQRFATNNGVSMAEARKMLTGSDLQEFKWDVNQYIQYGQENALMGNWTKELENASARFHISRLEALKIQTQNSLETMFHKQLGLVLPLWAMCTKAAIITQPMNFKAGSELAGILQGWINHRLKKYLRNRGRLMGRIFPKGFGAIRKS